MLERLGFFILVQRMTNQVFSFHFLGFTLGLCPQLPADPADFGRRSTGLRPKHVDDPRAGWTCAVAGTIKGFPGRFSASRTCPNGNVVQFRYHHVTKRSGQIDVLGNKSTLPSSNTNHKTLLHIHFGGYRSLVATNVH